MKDVRLSTNRLLIRDLPPRFGNAAARFHTENRHFHQRWEPNRPEPYFTAAAQRRILAGERRATDILHLWIFELPQAIVRPSAPVGSITISGIIRGFFQSAYLGYKLDSRHTRRGYMREALCAVVNHAFTEMGLHRLEANIMPANDRSLKLVAGLGFCEEGRSRRYLKIRGDWEDHLHLVMLSEQWRGCK